MTPLYPAGVYAPLPRFSKKTQTNIAPSATRNTASARCSRDAPIVSVAWSSKGSLPFPCFGEPSPRYSPRHVHSGSSHRSFALRRGDPPADAAQPSGMNEMILRVVAEYAQRGGGSRPLWPTQADESARVAAAIDPDQRSSPRPARIRIAEPRGAGYGPSEPTTASILAFISCSDSSCRVSETEPGALPFFDGENLPVKEFPEIVPSKFPCPFTANWTWLPWTCTLVSGDAEPCTSALPFQRPFFCFKRRTIGACGAPLRSTVPCHMPAGPLSVLANVVPATIAVASNFNANGERMAYFLSPNGSCKLTRSPAERAASSFRAWPRHLTGEDVFGQDLPPGFRRSDPRRAWWPWLLRTRAPNADPLHWPRSAGSGAGFAF